MPGLLTDDFEVAVGTAVATQEKIELPDRSIVTEIKHLKRYQYIERVQQAFDRLADDLLDHQP